MNFKDRLIDLIEEKKQTYTDMSDKIWEYAEPRFQEYESSVLQQEYLKSRGFTVKADLAGEETAFIAEYGSGKPVIAFLGEFDSLSALQQEADKTDRPRRRRLPPPRHSFCRRHWNRKLKYAVS